MTSDQPENRSGQTLDSRLRAAEARAAVAEARLRQLETVIHVGAIGLFDWPDVSAEEVKLSHAFLQGLGYPADHFTGTREAMAAIVHPQDLHLVVDNFAAAADSLGHRRYTSRLLLADGSYRWYETNLKGYQRPGQEHASAIATIVDVHDAAVLRIKNAALVEQHSFVIQAASAGVYDWPDIRNAYLRIETSLSELLGYARDEVTHETAYFWSLIHPEDVAGVERALELTWDNPNGLFDATYRIRFKSEGYRYVRSMGHASPIDAGASFRLTGALFEIHDAMVAKREAADAMEQLTQFSYVVAHDLAAPLRQLSQFAGILTEDYGAVLDEAAHVHLATMQQTAENAQGLIREMLEFSRVGTAAMRFGAVDLRGVIDTVVHMLDPTRAIDWQIDAMPTVKGDRTHLTMLFQNLLSNAIKFSAGTDRRTTIALSLGHAEAPMTEIRVTDNGVGFDPRDAEKIFRAFERAHDRTKYEGSGIGLANVARIVERHNGSITASGQVGKGATFVVRLPRWHA